MRYLVDHPNTFSERGAPVHSRCRSDTPSKNEREEILNQLAAL